MLSQKHIRDKAAAFKQRCAKCTAAHLEGKSLSLYELIILYPRRPTKHSALSLRHTLLFYQMFSDICRKTSAEHPKYDLGCPNFALSTNVIETRGTEDGASREAARGGFSFSHTPRKALEMIHNLSLAEPHEAQGGVLLPLCELGKCKQLCTKITRDTGSG